MTSKVVRVDVPTRPEPFEIEGSVDDFGVLGAIERESGRYEPHVMRFIADRARDAKVSFDIGANVGVLTVVIADASRAGTVYAFEPSPENHDFLEKNIARNGIANVRVFREGIYSTSEAQILNFNAGHPGGAFISDTSAREDRTDVITTRTLDDIVRDEALTRLDFVKLDVEGAELDVLAGGAAALARFRPVLLLECNPVPLRRFHDAAAEELFDRLREVYGSDVGMLALDGTPAAIYSRAHFVDELGRRGLLDLVAGVPIPRSRRAMLRINKDSFRSRLTNDRRIAWAWAKLRRDYEPEARFVHAPAFRARFGIDHLTADAGTTTSVAWRVRNRSHFWYWSAFPVHPVTASYRWLRDGEVYERDGIRTHFVDPLPPGGRTTLDLQVAMPTEPGSYVLEATLVQEAFAWFDQIDPSLVTALPVEVR